MSDTDPNAEPRLETEADTSGTTASPEAAAAAQEAAARIAHLEAEAAQAKDQALRALADAENIRRRAEREREDTAKYAIAKFAKDLLAVADNLRRAVESVPADTRLANEQINQLLTGVEATERQLIAAFDRAGVAKQEPAGQPFDPNFHQVMMEVEGTGKPAGTVVQVLQAGYTIHGRLLREAIVGVAKGEAGQGHQVDTSA